MASGGAVPLSVELRNIEHLEADIPHQENIEDPVYQQLKPSDHGVDAWKVLIAGFLFEALLWGFPVCFGVFQEHYSHLPELQGKNVALVGTVGQGVCYVGAPFSAALTKRFPRYQQHLIWFGWSLCIIALGVGSLTTQIGALVATQGLMYGVGFTVLYWPIMSVVNEWWVLRKGFAFGLIMSAGGAAGAILPFIFQSLLDKYGYKTTLRATSIALLVLTGPLIPFYKTRLPPTSTSALANVDWSFTKNRFFWIYVLATVVQGLGLFFPSVFLPSYATDLGFSNTIGALLLSVMAIAQFIGQCIVGVLSDKNLSITLLASICTITGALAVFLMWGFGHGLPLLIVFAIVFGIFGYGFNSIRAAMAKRITGDPTTMIALQAILIGCQGLGNILVGPISAELLRGEVRRERYGGGRYDRLVWFAGSCMVGSAMCIVVPWMGKCLR